MLIGYNKQGDGDFDKHYVKARKKVDVLCGLIVSGKLSREKALEIYGEIRHDFEGIDPGKAQLFKMIYENRIQRLCDQFCRK